MQRICAGALVVMRREGLHILLGKRSASRAFFPSVWDVPGGHCEPGETPEQALVRELHEEIGISPTTWRTLGAFDVPQQPGEEPILMYLYEVTAWTGTPCNCQPEEHAEVAWFTVAEACCLPLAHPDYPALLRRLALTT